MADGITRDASSLWCLGFARNTGLCSAYEVKLWGILDSLEQAWEHDCRDVLLERNCFEALHHVKDTLVI
ncbi:hypothetical protein J1N35_012455 [Gossypium stocksii]|uniref:RNase H type-1 domain-containing protein n=1 Tax=Gossypium stocksii TaxID=47602 RepID=A0A9D4ACE7_9ROSI|nr:hypothetical protein J1N35_012455 [Gossypium stocksii]